MGILGNLSIVSSLVFFGTAVWFSANNFLPKEYHLPLPPALTGPLTVNKPNVLEKLLEGKVLGPESIVVEKNVLYTCTLDGKCLKIVNGQIEKSIPMTAHTNCDGKRQTIPFCGRPLGIRRYTDQQFIVADAMLGLMLINFDEETKELLVPSMTIVEKKRLGFPDDLDIAADNDTIFFSDLSAKYGYSDVYLAFLEHINDGRLIEYKMSTGKLRVVVDGLVAANGVQMHPDKQSVLVCETAMARIHRYYFSGLKKGRQQIFVDNLPGFPDNIRLSSNGKSFFVALAFHRSEKSPHTFDKLGPWPFARKVLGEFIKLLPASFVDYFYAGSVHGIILELDLNGVIVRSWHDPNGSVISHISEADDDGGEFLYLSSFVNNYIGRMSKK